MPSGHLLRNTSGIYPPCRGHFPFLEPILSTDTRFDIDFINNTSLSSTPTLVLTLPPGRYTAQVSGADCGTGQAIVEIYELP